MWPDLLRPFLSGPGLLVGLGTLCGLLWQTWPQRLRRSWRSPLRPGETAQAAPEAAALGIVVWLSDQADTITTCLANLRAIQPAPAEILVIDNASPDHGAERIADLAEQGAIRLWRSQERLDQAALGNLSRRLCTRPLLLFLDGAQLCDQRLLAHLLPTFADDRVGAVRCPCGRVDLGGTVLSALQELALLLDDAEIATRGPTQAQLCVPGWAIRRSCLDGIDGWRSGPAPQAALLAQLQRAGWQLRTSPGTVLLVPGPRRLRALLGQHLAWSQALARERGAPLLAARRGRGHPLDGRFGPGASQAAIAGLCTGALLLWAPYSLCLIVLLAYPLACLAATVICCRALLRRPPHRRPWGLVPLCLVLPAWVWLLRWLERGAVLLRRPLRSLSGPGTGSTQSPWPPDAPT